MARRAARSDCPHRGTQEPWFLITAAFQLIVDLRCSAVGYEALIRGPGGKRAGELLGRVPETEINPT